jgi:hypothetical protein
MSVTITPPDSVADPAETTAADVQIAEINAARDVEIAEINADTTETIIESERDERYDECLSQISNLRLSHEDAQRSNESAMSDLRERMDTMQTQQSLILSRLETTPEPPPNPEPDPPVPAPEATPDPAPPPEAAPEPPPAPPRRKAHRWI